MKNKFIFFSLLFLTFFSVSYAQKSGEGWIKIDETQSKRMWIDTKGLAADTNEDIKVWAVESFNAPQSVDTSLSGIQKIKTHYTFCKDGMRYSISEIFYYNNSDNVIKNFKYLSDSGKAKYNYPVFTGSQSAIIFKKSMEIIKNSKR
jgi:hypothetical protein